MNKLAFLICILPLGSLNSQTSEAPNKNRISYQICLMHYFFNNETPIRFKSTYPQNSFPRPYKRILQSSIGIEFSRKINKTSYIEAELRHFYYKHNDYVQSQLIDPFEMPNGVMNDRQFIDLSLAYTRANPWFNKTDYYFSVGASARIIDVNFAQPSYITILDQTRINMLQQNGWSYGLFTRAGIQYSPWSRITLTTALGLSSFILLPDSQYSNVIKSRFDLSLRIGIGVNF